MTWTPRPRAGMRQASCTAEELTYLRSLFAGKATFRFGCEGGSAEAYCAKREVTLYDRTKGIYKALKFTVVEC